MQREKKAQGPEAFEAYYAGLYGERWPRLKASLAGPSRSLALRVLEGGGYETQAPAPGGNLPETWAGASPEPYFLDEASIARRSLPWPARGGARSWMPAPPRGARA